MQAKQQKIVRTFASVLVLGAGFAFSTATIAAEITGAGATFPYPVYAKWAEAYKAKTGIGMNYQSIGSGGGIKQIKAKTVDFGASDKPLTPAELDKDGLMQFPTVVGGIVPVYNIPGVASGALRLNGKVLADIFIGKIQKWNSPEIVALNKGVNLPNMPITIVHRSDGSGTTFVFTNYLAKVSPEWKEKVGNDSSVAWPAGVGGKGNEGVASFVQRIKGAIGYVEYAYAKENKIAYGLMQNRDGLFVSPDDKTFQAAAASADWEHAPGFYEILTDEPGKASWPITGATFILMHKIQDKPANAKEVLKFFDWAYTNGDKLAEQLEYVPLPDSVTKIINKAWKAQIKDTSGKAVW